MWCLSTVEYYSHIEKKEILPLATTEINPDGTLLSEISQRKTNAHLYVKSKNRKTQTHPYREHIGGCQRWIHSTG